jgi:hypothetical protein
MKDNAIVQFVGFETSVALDDFTSVWEKFAKRFFRQDIHEITLQQQVATRSRFKYLSRNEWSEDNFQFSFMGGRGSDYFPDHRVKVIQAGGYAGTQIEHTEHPENGIIQVLAFIAEENPKLDACRKLPHKYLNIYEAYYQSCLYSKILEFYVPEAEAGDLITELKKQFHLPEVGLYKECLVLEG